MTDLHCESIHFLRNPQSFPQIPTLAGGWLFTDTGRRRVHRTAAERRVRLQILPEAGAIAFDGKVYHLTPLVHRLVRTLAETPGRTVSYEVLHEKIWPDSVVCRAQIGHHRSRLQDQMESSALCDLIKTRYKWGLVLELEEHQVRIDDADPTGLC